MKPKVGDLIGDNSPIDEKKFDVLNSPEHKKENFKACAQPWASVHVNNDGNVFPCLAVSMGNIKEKKMKEIIFLEVILKNLKKL